MRFAVISDIHGNRPALEAVLADIERQNVEGVVNLGDSLSGPIDPRGTGDLLIDLKATNVRGNHDRLLIKQGVFELGAVDRFTLAQLEPRHLAWLEGLEKTQVHQDAAFLCHGTPKSDVTGWLDNFWENRTATIPGEVAVTAEAEGVQYPVMLCGHTHVPRAVRLRDGRLVVNPGSVGLQWIHGSPDARYGIIEQVDGAWSVTFRAVPYDHEQAAKLAEANGFAQWREPLVSGWVDAKGLF
ncbi:MAG TPA: metallophosphoesterase family protein [Devosiaceae bacterium]|jgi:putative phosphoesterase